MTVTFSGKKSKEKTIEDVRDIVIDFLNDNGFLWAEERVRFDGEKIAFALDCANKSFTKAVGLLCLLFTSDNKHGYMEFRPVTGMEIRVAAGGSWDGIYRYIESHRVVKIEY